MIDIDRRKALILLSALVASGAFAAIANTGSAGSMETAAYEGGYLDRSRPMFSQISERYPSLSGGTPPDLMNGWGSKWSGNVTIDSTQAKAVVTASIPSFKVGTITSFRNSWIVPIEDGKGVVTSIQVSNVSASTMEQVKSIVEESLKKGWKAGEPRLMRNIYSVPLLDSKDATIGYVMVDGRSGEILRRASTILTVTSEKAKTIASDAIKELKVGEVKDGGSAWMVSIEYKDKVVMTVLLGKLNTPASADAVKAVQDSLAKGWSAGEPKQLQGIYNVPIIDANKNTIGNIQIDGRTGEIAAGFPLPRR